MSPLSHTDHRPYPLPAGRWVMGQRWHDLLFAHWRVEPASIQRLLPAPLEVDTYDGSAWIAVVPFAMTDVRARGLPGIPPVATFLELNVRTYVRTGGLDGVYFFSLDAASRLAVAAARRWFHLPYFNARMALRRRDDWIDYQSSRTHQGADPAGLRISYRPVDQAEIPAPGSIESWSVDRYRLIVSRPDGRTMTGEIHHAPWQLQPAECRIHLNSMADWLGLSLKRDPDHVRFARFQDVLIWRPRVLTIGLDGTETSNR